MASWEDYFSVQIFFIILRETIESAIIISVLLSFLNQGLNDKRDAGRSESEVSLLENRSTENSLIDEKVLANKLRWQIWIGGILGLVICMVIGGIFIMIFYVIGNDIWSKTERIWEAIFSIISSVIISVMGLALLRINKMKEKWRIKLAHTMLNSKHGTDDAYDPENNGYSPKALWKRVSHWTHIQSRKYAMGILPFVTTLREGLEAVVFVGGIGVNQPFTAFPLAIISALALGSIIGVSLYKGGNSMSLQIFLVASTSFLYLVAAGLFSRGVWFYELELFVQKCGQDTSETGSGNGSYDISKALWHVNCCNGQTDGGWMIFNALLGWNNTGTYASVISYCLYWAVMITIIWFIYIEEKTGRIPIIPLKWQKRRLAKIEKLQKMKENIKIHSNSLTNLLNESVAANGGDSHISGENGVQSYGSNE